MNLYVELAYGSPSGRGIVAPLSGVQSYIAMARETGDELYRSLFLFEEDLREHFKVFKTIRSYRGNCHMKNLVLDLDAGKDDFETIVRMRQLLDKLETFGLTMDLWFSGTGFHLTCPDPFHIDPSPELPQILRQTLEAMELPHIDLKIYERSRIIRVANTVNKKSGLFKINFPQDLLVSPDAMVLIKALATHPKDIVLNKAAVPDLHHLVKSPIPATLSIDVKAEDPSRFVTCMQKLYARGPVKGRRHSDLIALVSSWRRAGLPSQAAATLAEKWIGMGADPMSSYEVTRAVADIYTKGYKLSCEHPVMKEFCDSRC